MIAAVKAEVRKLYTVRSTYVLTLIAFALVVAINFWAVGYKATGTIGHDYIQQAVFDSLAGIGILAGIVGVLLMTHEYRYNTIYYALVASTNRLKLLWAKFIAVMGYVVLFTLAVVALSVAAVSVGLQMGDHTLPAQTIAWGQMLARGLYYMCGLAAFGLLFAVLIRNQIGTLVLYLLAPGTVEALASLVLKERTVYLPFTALGSMITNTPLHHITRGESALVVLAWLAVGWIVAAILFVKRDAN